MPNFNFDLVDGAHNTHHRQSRSPQQSQSQQQQPKYQLPPSKAQQRLEALKQRIADELLTEKRLREIEQSKPKLDPLSLAPQNEVRKQRQTTALDHSFHVLVQSLKLDSWVQKELQTEMDKKSQEMESLQSQNDRLREIITLRQEANQRREEVLQEELDRLRSVTRRAAPPDITSAMDELREMKELVNAGADTLYDTLKQRAVSERLALVRTFTVRIREVQNLIDRQRDENTDGAQEWIDRFGMLEQEHSMTSTETNFLRNEVATLQHDVDEFEDVSATRKQKFEELIDELASLKADNLRLQQHSVAIQKQIHESHARHAEYQKILEENKENSHHHHHHHNRPQSATSGASSTSPPVSRPTSALPSRNNTNNNNNNNNTNNDSHQQQQNQNQQSNKPPRVPSAAQQREEAEHQARSGRQYHHNHPVIFTSPSNEEKAATALRRLRTTLDGMKKKIRHVRATHIEHLQERTELELFLRQCVDDVRRDLERASSTDVHLRFTPEEKQRVVDILSAKLRVLTALHKRTFPNKLSPAMDVNFPVGVIMNSGGDDNNNNNNNGTKSRSTSPPDRQQGGGESLNLPQQRPPSSSSGAGKILKLTTRSITPLQQQANYQLPHRSSSRGGAGGATSVTRRSTSKPPRSSPPSASASSSTSNRQHHSQQQQTQSHYYNNHPVAPEHATNASYSNQQQDHQQQDELMDSLWTKWQEWNSKIATKNLGGGANASSTKRRR